MKKHKTGSNRAKITAKVLGEYLVFLICLVNVCFWGVLIIPKWLINDSGWIAILFGTSKNVTKYGPRAPYLLQKHFNKYKKNMETCYKH